ncbi:metacaspase-9-like [Silene latifolia]|uniref:metacaspase-9-like n=1 Tax=Silene latifolia TaxID=37657 RepID=UPI003D7843CE
MDGGNNINAVLVGCNYHGTDSELFGCIYDVVSMKKVLISRFGFKEDNIELLTDEPNSPIKPTGANIKSALKRMVEHAQEGDLLFFHFSGHGTLISSSSKPHEHDKKHEAIVPCDFNLITDVDFRKLVNEIHPKSTFTMLSDSCHSGGLIDQEKEQIGPSTFPPPQTKTDSCIPKFIPLESILDKFKNLTGLDTPNIGDHMVQHFKDDASLSFRLTQADQDNILAMRAKKGDYGILLSGCQSDEYSQEDESSKPPHGVFSYAVMTVLDNIGRQVSNKEVVMRTRELLHEQGQNSQHPCLYCSDENADATFLLQPSTD